MIDSFVSIFVDCHWIVSVLIFASAVCFGVNLCKKSLFGFSVIGFLGIGISIGLGVSSVWGEFMHCFWMALDIIILEVALLGLAKLVIFLFSLKRKVSDFAVIDGNSVPVDEMGNPNYDFLLGHEGECVTDLKPIGKVKIDGRVYNVRSEKGYLFNGNFVVVVKTESSNIYVKKIKSLG